MRVVLVGGRGFLGSTLRVRLTDRGHTVLVLGRGAPADHGNWRTIQWDARTLGPWVADLEGADVIVHMAGKRVDCRPTRSNIDELIRSREATVELVGNAIASLDEPPTAWVQLSSLAIFGDTGDELITEATPPATTGLRQHVEVCRRWEQAYDRASTTLPRRLLLRPGINIGGAADPASEMLARLARFGLAGSVGTGRQWVSWIAAADLFDLLERSVLDDTMNGVYHLTSPTPVRNADLMAAYRTAVGKSFGLPAPRALATVGAWLLGSDPALVLTGRRCVPTRLLDEGYDFRCADIDAAVATALAD